MATCFVIMPVTTPEGLVPLYGKDPDHFSHVLEHLFVPAITRSKFDAIRPIAQGADVIHAEIVKNLETADLVLCDISALNPNVFFELGCRTALNRPVCYVMDDLTRTIPFDTGIINHHTYNHMLTPWTLDAEVDRLSAHILSSAERSSGKNMLWQYFGLRSSARAVESQGNEQDRLNYLVMQIDSIKKRLDEASSTSAASVPGTFAYSTKWNAATVDPQMFDYKFHDWDRVISDAEKDLEQIIRPTETERKTFGPRRSKKLITQHIESLGDLLNSESESMLTRELGLFSFGTELSCWEGILRRPVLVVHLERFRGSPTTSRARATHYVWRIIPIRCSQWRITLSVSRGQCYRPSCTSSRSGTGSP